MRKFIYAISMLLMASLGSFAQNLPDSVFNYNGLVLNDSTKQVVAAQNPELFKNAKEVPVDSIGSAAKRVVFRKDVESDSSSTAPSNVVVKNFKIDQVPNDGSVADPAISAKPDLEKHDWKTFSYNGLDVVLDLRRMQHYGDFYRLDVYILNTSGQPYNLDLSQASIKSSNGTCQLLSDKEFSKMMRRRHFWKSAGISSVIFAAAIATDVALNNSQYSHHRTFGGDVAYALGHDMIFTAASMGSAAVASNASIDMSKISQSNIGYLHSCTIPNNSSIQGHAYAKCRNGNDIIINLPINGQIYAFRWDTNLLKEFSIDEE